MVAPQAKLLVVDDEVKNVKLMEALLTPRGYAVVTASNGEEALQQVQREQPDLILLDVMMPIVDGFEVCKILKDNAETRLIPVVMMTSLGRVEDRIKGIEAGADDFLTKPVHRDELLARIRTSLRLKRTIEGKLDNLVMEKPQGEPAAVDTVFRQEGEYWTLAYEGTVCRLKDAKGLHYIASLLRDPGREFHAVDLVIAADRRQAPPAASTQASLSADQLAEQHLSVAGLGDAGEVLDAQAKAAYKRRLDDLQEDLEEAQRFNDSGRAAKARAELDFLAAELAAGVGLGGRDRKAAAAAERARLNVTKSIKASLGKISDNHPALGQHLSPSIKTGTFCSYTPDPTHPISWTL